ncbi:MAG: RNA methyltransferase [Lentisphaerae bacterium]|nr:RNA methyltransferase [Lentisphaerota bacterium]
MSYSSAQSVTITSAANPLYKKINSLRHGRGIRKHGLFIAGGKKILDEITDKSPEILKYLVVSKSFADTLPVNKGLTVLSNELFNELNEIGLPEPLAVVEAPVFPEFDPSSKWEPGINLFLPFGDPENVGAAIRSATGLGVARIILLRESANPLLPRAVRASAGTVLNAPVESGPSLEDLKIPDNIPFFALDSKGIPLDTIEPPDTFAVVAGSEGTGIPETLKRVTRLVSIPLSNDVESLNAAASVSILLWEWRRK